MASRKTAIFAQKLTSCVHAITPIKELFSHAFRKHENIGKKGEKNDKRRKKRESEGKSQRPNRMKEDENLVVLAWIGCNNFVVRVLQVRGTKHRRSGCEASETTLWKRF